jgi:hypothetical protein
VWRGYERHLPEGGGRDRHGAGMQPIEDLRHRLAELGLDQSQSPGRRVRRDGVAQLLQLGDCRLRQDVLPCIPGRASSTIPSPELAGTQGLVHILTLLVYSDCTGRIDSICPNLRARERVSAAAGSGGRSVDRHPRAGGT